MTANELRIGNWYKPLGGAGNIKLESDWISYFAKYIELLEGIPLTEEWLVKFGFKKADKDTYKIDLHPTWGNLEISITDTSFSISKYNSDSDVPGDALESVHRLQNLYFALTGIELTIK